LQLRIIVMAVVIVMAVIIVAAVMAVIIIMIIITAIAIAITTYNNCYNYYNLLLLVEGVNRT